MTATLDTDTHTDTGTGSRYRPLEVWAPGTMLVGPGPVVCTYRIRLTRTGDPTRFVRVVADKQDLGDHTVWDTVVDTHLSEAAVTAIAAAGHAEQILHYGDPTLIDHAAVGLRHVPAWVLLADPFHELVLTGEFLDEVAAWMSWVQPDPALRFGDQTVALDHDHA